jgi:hypothetical protein
MKGGPMRNFSRWADSVFHILCGAGIALPPALLLLFAYHLNLTDPRRPDYHMNKIRLMFSDTGFLAWPAAAGVLFGIGIAVVGGLRAFLREPQGEDFADAWREKAGAASGRFRDRVRPVPSERSITPIAPMESDTSTDILASDEVIEVNKPQSEAKEPQRSLVGWLVRNGLIGAVAAPPVAMGVEPYGWLSAETLYLSPILGLVVGSVCGIIGWGVSKVARV